MIFKTGDTIVRYDEVRAIYLGEEDELVLFKDNKGVVYTETVEEFYGAVRVDGEKKMRYMPEVKSNDLAINFHVYGIQCDNESCDYAYNNVIFEQYAEWLNKPCPLCGDNLLTEESFVMIHQMKAIADTMNAMTPEELIELQGVTEIMKDDNPIQSQLPDDLPSDAMIQVRLSTKTGEIEVKDVKVLD